MSSIFKIDLKDAAKGLVVAVLIGGIQVILTALQGQGIEAFSQETLMRALDMAIKGGAAYLMKNYLSDESGKVLGKIG